MNTLLQPYPFDFVQRCPGAAVAEGARQAHPIVIVGGGVAGLTLALDLAAQGVASVVIEADATVCEGSRAICFSRRSLEIFERIGVLDTVLAKGLPWSGGRSYYRSTEVLHFQMPHDALQKLPPMVNLQQYHLEEALVRALGRRAGLVGLRWQSRVVSVLPELDRVELEIECAGSRYRITADWVVACDGGRSLLRERLGLRLEGTAYEGRYVVVDIAMKCDLPTERLAWFDPPSNPGSTILMHRQPDDIWRIDYQIADDADPDEAVKPANVLPRVRSHLQMMGLTAPWAPIWITLYKANALSLARYREGRVLFAGDAAHLVPIFGVRGANSSIDDVDNLAWKLALVHRGRADAALLDSYSSERVQAARENLDHGRKSTQFMAPPDFAFQAMREAVLNLARDTPALRSLINPRQSTAIRYDASPLNATRVGEDGFAAGPGAGSVLACGPVIWQAGASQRAGHLTDALQAGAFCVLHFADRGPLPEPIHAFQAHWAAAGVAMRSVTVRLDPEPTGADHCAFDAGGPLTTLYGATDGGLYLVRPDGHVLGRWTQPDPPAWDAAMTRCLAGAPMSASFQGAGA
jgi:3-(3-hydroxy-phenyl)propionate hydroxylase